MSYDPRSYFDLRSELDKKFMLIEVIFDAHKLLEQIVKELKNERAKPEPFVDTERDPDTGVAINPWATVGGSPSNGGNALNQKRGPGRPRNS